MLAGWAAGFCVRRLHIFLIIAASFGKSASAFPVHALNTLSLNSQAVPIFVVQLLIIWVHGLTRSEKGGPPLVIEVSCAFRLGSFFFEVRRFDAGLDRS